MLELIVCTFPGPTRAEEAQKALQNLDRELDTVKLGNIAILRKDEQGQLSFAETGQAAAATQGTTIGALCGAIMGLLAGPVGVVAGAAAGAAAGSTIRAIDLGFPDPVLKQLNEYLEVGSSALVTLLNPEEKDVVVEELLKLGGSMIEHTLPDHLVDQLLAAEGKPGTK